MIMVSQLILGDRPKREEWPASSDVDGPDCGLSIPMTIPSQKPVNPSLILVSWEPSMDFKPVRYLPSSGIN